MQQGEINYVLIGQRIRKKRLAAGMTQEFLAEKLDVAPEYLSQIENGRAKINLKRLAELSVLLDTPIEYFVAGCVYSGDSSMDEIASAANSMTPGQRKHLAQIVHEIRLLTTGE